MEKKVCCFSWLKKKINVVELKPKLKKEIKKLVINFNVTKFFVRAESDFDSLCLECVKEIKSEYPRLKLYLVVLTVFSSKVSLDKIFDEIIYLNFGEMSSQLLKLSLFDWLISKPAMGIGLPAEYQLSSESGSFTPTYSL